MINEEIRDKEIRLIGSEGEQLGIVSSAEAQKLADEKNLDLVKIAPQAKPPVCKIMDYGKHKFELAKREKLPVIVLAGRPYHIDPEINHGIDKLICELGAVVVSEDSVAGRTEKFATTVLNQWTYHARLYSAAKFVSGCEDLKINLVQLVSFGCGVDAVTTDEVRSILERNGKLYTQIKIDEITNLGAVKIRLRSLFAVTEGE